MWVKICGTTNLVDARTAVEAGADAIGFVLAPSKRRVTPEQVAEITRQLPEDVLKIGVLVNETVESTERIVRSAGLNGVQLQGDETPELVRDLKKLGLRFLAKTIAASSSPERVAERISAYSGVVDTILLDSGGPAERGGTGKRFDWPEVARQIAKAGTGWRIIVAGGLNPANVSEAIATLRPWGVDVVTGVERETGRKDPEKVQAFITAARKSNF